MDLSGRARPPTPGHTGSTRRQPCLLAWVFEREVALAHRSYWGACRSPATTALAVLLYPAWLVLAVPAALLLGLLKVALLGALVAAIAGSAFGTARRLSRAPVPVRRR
ncbi:MAG TPA: hypothetical protein VMT17_06795 [Anaeromyxobacteraceae bacterium]|nr:hypothetical protein [Anaeromyxobacteraceae bacterium]